MDKLLCGTKKITSSRLGKIFLANIALLTILLLIFTPTEKLDDYRMKFILAGAASGESNSHLLYSSIFLGKALQMMTKLIPVIPWYEFTQYTVLFLSFCVLVYLVMERELGTVGTGFLSVLLAVFGYETYIKLTFTKSAGIAAVAGIALLLEVLDSENRNNAKDRVKGAVGLFLIVMSSMLRFKIFMLVFAIFILMYDIGYRVLCTVVDAEKGTRQGVLVRTVRTSVRRWSFLIILFVCLYGVRLAGNWVFVQDDEWAAYKEFNEPKVELQDYGWPNYNEYYNEYQELGISTADYTMWNKRNYSDPDLFTTDLMLQVMNMKSSHRDESGNQVWLFFRRYPLAFTQEICFWGFLPLLLCFCVGEQHHKKLFIAASMGMLMAINFYFFMAGRYGQHHVDVAIWIAISFLYIMNLEKINLPGVARVAGPAALAFIVWIVQDNYSYLRSTSYYGSGYNRSVGAEEAREVLELMAGDESHLYITDYSETKYAFQGYSVFEQIPAGGYQNIYCLADYMYPTNRFTLDRYGIYNIYHDIVNNSGIYYFQSSDNNDGSIGVLLDYLRDNYNPDVYSCLVKSVNGVRIYCIPAQTVPYKAENARDVLPGQEGFTTDITATVTDEILTLGGVVYKEGVNSFNNRIYLEMYESDCQGTIYQVVTQMENYASNDVMNGKYGRISCKVYVPTVDWTSEDRYAIILECDEGTYRIPITVEFDTEIPSEA